jgi:hypothetical protein
MANLEMAAGGYPACNVAEAPDAYHRVLDRHHQFTPPSWGWSISRDHPDALKHGR